MSLDREVDRLVDERPGPELMAPSYDDPAHLVTDFLYRSGGSTAAYCLLTDRGRIIVNTGLGYEAVHHKRVFDALRPGPTPYIVTTQGHVDHVGGVALFREPSTVYVAQANNPSCQRDDARIQAFRMRTAAHWFDVGGEAARRIARENPGVPMRQDRPVPDLLFDRRLALRIDGLSVELLASVGETIDSAIVWLPEHRVALISNLLGPLFPHFPNFNTLRGDRYRLVEPYLATVRLLRELRPAVLVTGRHEPVAGEDLIDASLARLHDAVDWVHRRTLEGINAGTDLWTLMGSVELPARLRVGQGYGKVSWAVRTIWETYIGWFKLLSTTELYPDEHLAAMGELVAVAGPEVVLDRAEAALARSEPVVAVHLAEAVLDRARREPASSAPAAEAARARAVLVAAHRQLRESGGAENFWEAGWLRDQLDRFAGPPGDPGSEDAER